MYRKLVWIPVLAFCALTAAMAYLAGGPRDFRQSLPLAAQYARLVNLLLANAAGNLRLAATFFVTGLMPMLVGLGLTWVAAFHPSRKPPALLALAKYAAILAVAAQLILHLFYRAEGVATGAYVLAQQIDKPLLTRILVSGFPEALAEVIAISFILSAPLYWLFRSIRVSSLERATFEAWVEIKRLIIPALACLVAAAFIQVWASPAITASVLK